MQFDWWTFALQAINFLVLVWLLQRFLYKPIQKAIDDRRATTAAKTAEASAILAEAQATKGKYEAALGHIAQERHDMLDQAHQEIEAQRASLLAEARSNAQALARAARDKTTEERAETLKDMQSEIGNLAKTLATKILEESGRQLPNDAALAMIESALSNLPVAERERIDAELSVNGAGVNIVTAHALEPKEQRAWQERLAAHFGNELELAFTTDPSIIAGTELRFPHTIVKSTWSDQLETITKGLNADAHTS
jgi:F-type H+-transporting ATPase subunit b